MLVGAGVGSRLRPLTDVLPKCLVPINGRPLLGIWLETLSVSGINNIVLNVHHHAELVTEYVRRCPYHRIVTVVYEPELLGTAGTLLHNRQKLAGAPVLFAHADNLTQFSLAEFVAAHRARPSGTVITMMTFETDRPSECGIVELDDYGRVTEFHEKLANPPGNLANAAVYLLEPEVFAFLASLGWKHIDFSIDVLPRFLGRISTFQNRLYHRDIGTPHSLFLAQSEWPKSVPQALATKGTDPWFGLMNADDARLEQAFAAALAKMTYFSNT